MSDKFFTPSEIGSMSAAEIRKAYSRLRSIANKRIGRLEQQGLDRGYSKFPTIKEISGSSRMNVGSVLADVSRFIRSDRTTVTGAKKFLSDFREQMQVHGYGSLVDTVEKAYKMMDYMEQLRERYSDKLFDSGDALDVLEQGERLNIPTDKLIENYDLFASNLESMEKVKPSKEGKEFSQRRINTLIKRWSK